MTREEAARMNTMPNEHKYIQAVSAATIIAEKHGIPLADLVDTFADIPAADVAPVRHGRWIEKTAHVRHSYFECSNCGAHENKHTEIKGRFCWSCGAIMDGDTQWLST